MTIVEQIAYERQLEAVKGQSDFVDDVRKRSLTVAGFVITICVLLLRGAQLSPGEPGTAVAAIFSAIYLVAVAFINFPSGPRWKEYDNGASLLDKVWVTADERTVYKQLTLYKRRDYESNEFFVSMLSSLFKFQLGFSAVVIIMWSGVTV